MTGLSHSSVDLHLNQYNCARLAKGCPENEHGITAQSPASADTSASSRLTQRSFWQGGLMILDEPVNKKNVFYAQRFLILTNALVYCNI